MTERFIRVGTRAVIFNEVNEILVVHLLTQEANYYYLPGGGVRFHEKIDDCLVREVEEETGLQVKAERLLWVRDFLEGLPDPHGIEIFFLATITGGKFQPVHDSYSHAENTFTSVEELERIRFYPTSLISKLKQLRDNRDWSETNVYMRSAP
ncbi:MAG: NUDIX hydrolase [Candidatus Bathyarchaeota archaeon]|nr:MAG: NUDIX hydrolase [Candidatus Bathyarchaeota archaeon]